MTDAVLDEVRRLAAQNKVWVSSHARDEAADANATRADVRHALTNGISRSDGDRLGRHVVVGPDLDGDALSVVVVIEDGVIVVITVF